MTQCRARYEALKKGKGKATASVDGDRSPRPPDDGEGQDEPSETTRPAPRKRSLAKGKGKQPITSLREEDSTQADDIAADLLPKRPKGRPRKVIQALGETPKTPGDGRSNAERVTRPAPRKRGRPPKVKSHESPTTTEGAEAGGGQNTPV